MDRLIEIQRYNPHAEQYGIRRVPPHLRQAAALPIGLPFLKDVGTGRIIKESLSFSLAVAEKPVREQTGRSGVATAMAYIYPMRGLCEVARGASTPLRHLDDDLLSIWVADRIADGSLKRRTIVDGIKANRRWLRHCNDQFGYGVEIDFDTAIARTWGLDSLYDANGKLRDTSGVDASRAYMIRTLDKASWGSIESASGPHPGAWRRHGPSSRPRLAHLFGIEGGCRLVEATAGMHFDEIMAVDVRDPDREYEVRLKASKGIDGRPILLAGDVIQEAQAYGRGERAACVEEGRRVCGSLWSEPPELLVNGFAAGRYVGQAVAPESIQRDLRRIQAEQRMIVPVRTYDKAGKVVFVDRPLHCYHDLRHTNARGHFDIAIARGESFERAVEIVQERLGHSDRSTTERIYLFRDKRLVARAGDLIVARVRSFGGAR